MVINAQSQSLLVAGESVRRTPHHKCTCAPPPPPPPLPPPSPHPPTVLPPTPQLGAWDRLPAPMHGLLTVSGERAMPHRARARQRRTSSCSTTSSGVPAASEEALRPCRRCVQRDALSPFPTLSCPCIPWGIMGESVGAPSGTIATCAPITHCRALGRHRGTVLVQPT